MNTFKAFIIALMMLAYFVNARAKRPSSRLLLASTRKAIFSPATTHSSSSQNTARSAFLSTTTTRSSSSHKTAQSVLSRMTGQSSSSRKPARTTRLSQLGLSVLSPLLPVTGAEKGRQAEAGLLPAIRGHYDEVEEDKLIEERVDEEFERQRELEKLRDYLELEATHAPDQKGLLEAMWKRYHFYYFKLKKVGERMSATDPRKPLRKQEIENKKRDAENLLHGIYSRLHRKEEEGIKRENGIRAIREVRRSRVEESKELEDKLVNEEVEAKFEAQIREDDTLKHYQKLAEMHGSAESFAANLKKFYYFLFKQRAIEQRMEKEESDEAWEHMRKEELRMWREQRIIESRLQDICHQLEGRDQERIASDKRAIEIWSGARIDISRYAKRSSGSSGSSDGSKLQM